MSAKIVFFQVSMSLGLVVGVAACSSGASRVEGTQCPKRWDPVQMNVPPAAKTELKPQALPDGTFKLQRAMLHFHGDPTDKSPEGFQVMVKEEIPPKSEQKFVTRADCFRNANVDRAYGASVTGLTEVIIKNGQVVSSAAKPFGFTMSETGQFELTQATAQSKSERLQDLFVGSTETFVVKWSNDMYEIRTKGRATNGEYALTTLMFRAPDAPTP